MDTKDCRTISSQYQHNVRLFTSDKNNYAFAGGGKEDIEIGATPDKIVVNRPGLSYVLSLGDFKTEGNPYVFKALSIFTFKENNKKMNVLEIGSEGHQTALLDMKKLIIKKRDSFSKNSLGRGPLNKLIAKLNLLLDFLDFKNSCKPAVRIKS